MVNRLFSWGSLRPAACFALVVLLALAALPGALRVQFESSAEGLRRSGDPAVVFFEEIKATFGETAVLTVMIESDDLFRPEILRMLPDLTDRLGKIDGVEEIVSLATVANLSGEAGIIHTGTAINEIPAEESALRELRDTILANNLLTGEVIDREGRAAAIHLFLRAPRGEGEFERRVVGEVEREIARAGEALGDTALLYACGVPYVKAKVLEEIRTEVFRLTPAACVIMFLILLWHFRSAAAALLPNLTGLISVLLTLGFMGYSGIPVNPLTTIVPILVLVIGSTEDVHLTCAYARALARGATKPEALLRLGPECGLATLVTAGTTLAGFAALIPSRIPMLSQFGLACSFGMVANLVVTVLTVPLFLKLAPVPPAFRRAGSAGFSRLGRALAGIVERRGRLVFAGFAGTALLAAAGMTRVTVDTDYLTFFRPDSEVALVHERAARHLGGTRVFQVVLEAGAGASFADPAALAEAARLSDFIRERTDQVTGYPDLIRQMHGEFHGGDEGTRVIPGSASLIAQYNLLLAEDDLKRFVSPDFARLSLLVRDSTRGSAPLNALIGEIDRAPRLLGLESIASATVTGDEVLIARTSDAMSRQLVVSLSLVFAVIFFCLALTCRSWRAGVLGIVPNVFPVLMLFGLMGWTGIDLSTATYPVAIIALGIAVDDTLHFLLRFYNLRREGVAGAAAVREVIEQELAPIVFTTNALVGGFLVASLAGLACIHRFGLLGAFVMLTALATDLALTPLLLRRFGR